MKHFGTDGIRKKAEEFSADFLATVARGLADYGGENMKVLLAGDTRESSEWMLTELMKAFEALGVDYALAEVLPTPAINYCFVAMGFDFAVDITASHNPYIDNGIKIFEKGPDGKGQKLSKQGHKVIEEALSDLRPLPEVALSDREDLHEEALAVYEEHLLSFVKAIRPVENGGARGDFAGIKSTKNTSAKADGAKVSDAKANFSGLKIGLDCANGATSVVGGTIFEQLGAEVFAINTDSSYGTKINDNAGSTHIEGLQQLVREKGLDFGAAFDGDGDRCLLVDNEGEVVDGDQIVAILTGFLGLPAAAVTVMSNQGLFDWAVRAGVELEVTAVGDANVALAMKEKGILIGGEQSGHIILPGETTGDGMLTALVVAKVVAVAQQSLHALASEMPKFPQVITDLEADAAAKERFKSDLTVAKLLDEYSTKLSKSSGRLLVRPSGTENLIRITMWGKDLEGITALAEELKGKLKEIL